MKKFLLRSLFLLILILGFGIAQGVFAVTSSEIFSAVYGGFPMSSTPGVTQTNAGKTYVCAGTGTYVTPDSSGYPSGFFVHPEYYCSTASGLFGAAAWFSYGHQAPQPSVFSSSGGSDYVSPGGSYFGGASINISIPSSAVLYSTQTCSVSAANACGATATGYRNVYGGCDVTAPSLPANYGQACSSSANSCGYKNTGTIQCDGSCSASTPANPVNYGKACTSSANACGGKASGTILCSGACSASTPANPPNYGQACTSTPNSCGQTNAGTIQCDTSCSATAPSNSSCAINNAGCYGQGCTTPNGSGASCNYPSSAQPDTANASQCCATTPGICPEPPSPNVVSALLSADPLSIVRGFASTLVWSSLNASSCTGTNFETGNRTSGTIDVKPSSTTLFSLDCEDAAGNHAYDTQTVSVTPFQLSLTASPTLVRSGDSSVISWSELGAATSCEVSGPGLDSTQLSGSATLPISVESTYTFSCKIGNVSSSQSVTVKILPAFREF